MADSPAFRFFSASPQVVLSTIDGPSDRGGTTTCDQAERPGAWATAVTKERSVSPATRVSRVRLVEHLDNTRADPAEAGGIGCAQVAKEDVSNFRALRA